MAQTAHPPRVSYDPRTPNRNQIIQSPENRGNLTYQRMIFGNVSSIFNAAVDDDFVIKNPCRARSVRAPKKDTPKVVPWTAERVEAVTDALPERYKITAIQGAGLGLRQGEIFGLSPDDVDFLGRSVAIRRQVRLFTNGSMAFRLPKGGKSRTVPLPQSVALALSAHIQKFPPVAVTLPWDTPEGKPLTVELIVTTPDGKALSRNDFNRYVWGPTLEEAKVERTSRADGMHALRHYYASVLLDAGESIKAVSEYLGHTDPGFTLRTYTHLMPSSAERTRKAVDAALSSCAPIVPREAAK
ncbi:MAG: tyrosine-type recombinase/integrase [Propionibacteriales bacterium]|nr:tyrosine-type recombinase/integrase [Propionibacteriales bacterium]